MAPHMLHMQLLYDVRRAFARGRGHVPDGATAALTELLSASRDEDLMVRLSAISALGRTRSPEAVAGWLKRSAFRTTWCRASRRRRSLRWILLKLMMRSIAFSELQRRRRTERPAPEYNRGPRRMRR